MTTPTAASTPDDAPVDASTETPVFTRADYLGHRCSHEEYYAQFVNESVRRLVRSFIREDVIVRSTDPHFNDIPLRQWDNLDGLVKSSCNVIVKRRADPVEGRPQAFSWSPSDTVCIAKEAARQIKMEAFEVATAPRTIAEQNRAEAEALLRADQDASLGVRHVRRPGV